jgi:putative oxidoreductase
MNHLIDRSSGFIEHGYAKLARGPDDFANILHALGMPAAPLLSWATVLIELLGGFAVMVGAFIPLASVPRGQPRPPIR